MTNAQLNQSQSKLILIGFPFVTLFLVLNSVTDPVNAPKMFALGGFAGAFLALILRFSFTVLRKNTKVLTIMILLFIGAMTNAVVQSNSPISQNVYGVFGRNTGFLTYLFLAIILLGVSCVSGLEVIRRFTIAFLIAGITNVIYCLWVLLFGDFIPWNNPYGAILGFFGNPNFISSFLGMLISGSAALFVSNQIDFKYRISLLLLSIVAFFEILQSKSIQGIAVSFFGVSLVLLMNLRSRFKTHLVPGLFFIVFFLIGVLGIFGALQKGPLDFIYKKSVSLRGVYWETGFNIGKAHPFSGVGMDSYGDWYRAYRPEVALIDTPGPKVSTNAAHNVFLDLFAYGGFPLIISYLLILSLAGVSAVKVIRRGRGYDRVFTFILVIWATYILQSLISINQIGLAVWGWGASGALIAYERISRVSSSASELKGNTQVREKSSKKGSYLSANLIASIGALIGFLVATPPLSGDLKWKSALDSRNVANVQMALQPAYLNPASSFKYGSAVSLFSENGFQELAYKYARESVKFNPDFADAWRQLYSVQLSTDSDKKLAMKNLKRLDPNNPDPLGLNP